MHARAQPRDAAATALTGSVDSMQPRQEADVPSKTDMALGGKQALTKQTCVPSCMMSGVRGMKPGFMGGTMHP